MRIFKMENMEQSLRRIFPHLTKIQGKFPTINKGKLQKDHNLLTEQAKQKIKGKYPEDWKMYYEN